MIEIPEAVNLANQLREHLAGKQIADIVAAQSPHKFAWYYGEPDSYKKLVVGKTFSSVRPVAGFVEGSADDIRFLFSEGINLRYHEHGAQPPKKHQLLISFTDGSTLSASVQMYGGVGAFRDGECDNPYYQMSKEKLSPLAAEFTWAHFSTIASDPSVAKLSAKAFLATEQRIPGLGNGVLQDILFSAKLNPKTKVVALGDDELKSLHRSIKKTLKAMAAGGGRDTELDLFGNPGGYATIMSRKNVGGPCPHCGTPIEKAAYLGGSVYYCPACQPVGSVTEHGDRSGPDHAERRLG